MLPLKMQKQIKENYSIMNSGQNQEKDDEVAKGVRLLISGLGLCL